MKTLKAILKKILPVPLLKKAFLVYNTLRVRTIDRIIFPEYPIAESQFRIYRNGFPFVDEKVSLEDLPAGEVKNYMKDWYGWTQEEFLLEFNQRCCIEPDYGWAIVPRSKLVYYSLGVSRTLFQPKPRIIAFLKRKKMLSVPKAISLRDTGEENYFHCFNDVLSKIFFLRQHGVAVDHVPLIISKKLWSKPYFQYYFSCSSFLQSLTWLVQDDEYIECESVIFCKPLTHRSDLWREIVAPLSVGAPKSAVRKIFLTRHKSRLRFIENSGEIEILCRNKGYEIVDTDVLSLAQQVELFSTVSHLVGIHGAGLTNMAFCPPGCRVLELFPPPDLGYLPYHYILLAKIKRFNYRALIGTLPDTRFSGGFRIDPTAFGDALRELDL